MNYGWARLALLQDVPERGVFEVENHSEKASKKMDMEWARRWLSLFKADSLDQMMEFYADSFEHRDVTVGHRSTNKQDLRAFYAAFMKEGSDNQFVPTACVGTADAGAVEWTWRVRHRGRAFGINVEGKETFLSGTSVIETRGGLIVRQYDYWDLATMLRQLGVSIPEFS